MRQRSSTGLRASDRQRGARVPQRARVWIRGSDLGRAGFSHAMIGLPESVRILLFTEPTDMRKGFDGLGSLVAAAGEDIYAGHLYVFLSRRRNRAKVLTFQKGGFVLWYKRLERGRFRPVADATTGRVAIDATELAMMLDGIDVARVRRAKHWQPKKR